MDMKMYYELDVDKVKTLVPEFDMSIVTEQLCENTGGGCMVDFYILNDKRCVSVTDENIVLWKELDDFSRCCCDEGSEPIKVMYLV